MNFTKQCRSGQTDCPISDSDKPATIDFDLISENFCAEISVDIGLVGTIEIYEDSSFQNVKKSFIAGRRAYLLITLNSDVNPSPYSESTAAIKLTNCKLYGVTLRSSGSSNGTSILKIYQNGSLSSDDSDFETQLQEIDRSQGNMVGFSFVFSSKLVSELGSTSSSSKLTIGAEVQVSYTQGTKKRDVLATSGTDRSTLSTDAEVTTNQSDNNGNFGNLIVASILLLIIALTF